MSYRFLLFPEDKIVLLNDILCMNKWYVTVTAKFQFWQLERPWQQWQWTGMKYNFQFSYLKPSRTLCEEKNHKAHIRNPLLSMQSMGLCTLLNAFTLHLNCHKQRITRLQMVKCHILSWYTCKYNSIYVYKRSTAFHAPTSTKQTCIM